MSSGTPEKAILPSHAGAVVEPLAIVQEGEVAWAAVRVSLDGVDLYGEEETEKHIRSLTSRKNSWLPGKTDNDKYIVLTRILPD